MEKEFVTDCVTASRTCLMTGTSGVGWAACYLFWRSLREILPEIRENAGFFGKALQRPFWMWKSITASIAEPNRLPCWGRPAALRAGENNLWDRIFC